MKENKNLMFEELESVEELGAFYCDHRSCDLIGQREQQT